MYSYLLSKVLDRALNEVPLLYETFTIPLPPGRLYFLRLKKLRKKPHLPELTKLSQQE